MTKNKQDENMTPPVSRMVRRAPKIANAKAPGAPKAEPKRHYTSWAGLTVAQTADGGKTAPVDKPLPGVPGELRFPEHEENASGQLIARLHADQMTVAKRGGTFPVADERLKYAAALISDPKTDMRAPNDKFANHAFLMTCALFAAIATNPNIRSIEDAVNRLSD